MFQFTPVSRRATLRRRRPSPCPCRFNSRPSRDGRRDADDPQPLALLFQFTPVSRRATKKKVVQEDAAMFQFTPVSRRATLRPYKYPTRPPVSIHARLATGDRSGGRRPTYKTGFNSRPSRDGRQSKSCCGVQNSCFNSRPSRDGRPMGVHNVADSTSFNSRPSRDGRRISPSS